MNPSCGSPGTNPSTRTAAYWITTILGPASFVIGGVLHLTRHLAVYWARDRVRVNCLCPGPFPRDTAPPEMVRRLYTKNPMGRMGHPSELKGNDRKYGRNEHRPWRT